MVLYVAAAEEAGNHIWPCWSSKERCKDGMLSIFGWKCAGRSREEAFKKASLILLLISATFCLFVCSRGLFAVASTIISSEKGQSLLRTGTVPVFAVAVWQRGDSRRGWANDAAH